MVKNKTKILDEICEMLGVEDYAQMPVILQQLLEVTSQPVYGVITLWKPDVLGSQQVTTISVPQTFDAAQQTSAIMHEVAQYFTKVALDIARTGMEEKKDAKKDPNGEGDNTGAAVC